MQVINHEILGLVCKSENLCIAKNKSEIDCKNCMHINY